MKELKEVHIREIVNFIWLSITVLFLASILIAIGVNYSLIHSNYHDSLFSFIERNSNFPMQTFETYKAIKYLVMGDLIQSLSITFFPTLVLIDSIVYIIVYCLYKHNYDRVFTLAQDEIFTLISLKFAYNLYQQSATQLLLFVGFLGLVVVILCYKACCIIFAAVPGCRTPFRILYIGIVIAITNIIITQVQYLNSIEKLELSAIIIVSLGSFVFRIISFIRG